MKTSIIALCMAFAVQCMHAGPEKPAQNMERVREIAAMLPEQPGFPSVRADAREHWRRSQRCYAVKRADALLAKPRTVNDESCYTNILFHGSKVAREMMALVTAECIENGGKYLPRIIEMMDDLCAARTWMNPYHDRSCGNFFGRYRSIDLNGGQIGMSVAFTIDLLGNRIPEATVKKAMECCRLFIVEPYLKSARTGDCRRHSWFFGHNNWNPACHWQSAALAMSILPDRMERAEFIEAAERAVPFFIRGFSKEGYCQEGLDYWNYGFGEFLRLAHIVYNVTGGRVDFSKAENAKRCFMYSYEFQLSDRCSPQFNDGTASVPSARVLYMGEFFWPETKSDFTVETNPFQIPHPVIAVRPDAFAPRTASGKYKLPLRTFFEDAQVFIARPSAPDANSLAACIKGGHNGVPHNHNDAGQFIIALGSVQMVQDPGGKVYDLETFTSKRYNHPMLNSYAHAVPLPDGTLQAAGKKSAAKVLFTSFTEKRDEIAFDLTSNYTNANIVALTRAFAYTRGPESVTVSDHAVFAEDGAYETPISTFGKVERLGGNRFSIVRETEHGVKRLDFTVDAHGAPWHIKEEKIPNPTRVEPTRWAVVIDRPAKEHRVTFRFTSRDDCPASGEGPVKMTPDGRWGVKVAYADGSVETFAVAPPERVSVKGEKHNRLPPPGRKKWASECKFLAVRADECMVSHAVEKGSEKITTADGRVLTRGRDYKVDQKWGGIERLEGASVSDREPISIDYVYRMRRIDSVIRRPDGKTELRNGVSHVANPLPPDLAPGEIRLGNVFTDAETDSIAPRNLFPVLSSAPPAPKVISTAKETLPKTWGKLVRGEKVKILAWGDSVTFGRFVSEQDKWQQQFVRRLRARFPKADIELVSNGWGSHRSDDFLKAPPGDIHNFDEKVVGVKADLVVSEFLNDYAGGDMRVRKFYPKYLEAFRKAGSEWIILTPHYVRLDWMGFKDCHGTDDDPRPYVKAVRKFAAENGIALADASLRWGHLWREGIPYSTLFANDINHPVPQGMTFFADALMALFPED